jgi:hypothetical protein
MTDRELLKRIDNLLMNKSRWSGNPNFGDKKAYVTFLIKDYADIVIDLGNQLKQSVCERCGEVNPAEIHTCSPQEPQIKQRTGDCLLTGVCAAEGHHIQKPRREWVGLTDEEIMDACSAVWASHPIEVGRVVEAKLKEKNS